MSNAIIIRPYIDIIARKSARFMSSTIIVKKSARFMSSTIIVKKSARFMSNTIIVMLYINIHAFSG